MTTFHVRIKKDNTSVKAGEVYVAHAYALDETKVTLVARVPDGWDPGVNQYRYEVDVLSGLEAS